tara:strand:+ start:192 stop:2111 length:1920 start_codon:yes stop_codon:yes gene_type:complete
MIKNYITLFTLVLSLSSIAQVKLHPAKSIDQSKINNILESDEMIRMNRSAMAPSTNIVWESDFTDPNDWTIDNTGSLSNEGWSIDPTVNSWYLQSFSSTSGGNFAELGNGDPTAAGWNGPIQVEYTLTTANPINIFDSIGSGNATLSFEEYGARFNDVQAIQVSTDGINFTTIGDNLSYPVTSQSAGSNPYPNPSLREINLAPYIGSTPSTVWIRFSWTTNYPTQATDPNVWITYGWCIDDVIIAESPANRVTMEDVVIGGFWLDYLNYSGLGPNAIYGLDYSITPLSQLQNHPYSFEALFRNEGTASQSVNLQYDVASGTSGSSNTVVLNPGDSVFLGASFAPSNTGLYSIDIWGVADSAGAGITTNMTSIENRNILVTDYIYGKDLGETNSSEYILGGLEDQNHITTRFEMYADENLYSLRAYIGESSLVGAEVKAIIYEIDSTISFQQGGAILIAESDNYTITAQDLGAWVDIPFVTPINLYNGYAYEFGIVGFQHPSLESYVGTSGFSLYNGEHSLYDEFGLSTQSAGTPTWYYISATPMVRMNFDPSSATTSLHENKTNILNVYPNPSNGLLNINQSANDICNLSITNLIGQVVYKDIINNVKNIIDLSHLDKGVYLIEINDNRTIFSKRLIIE